MKLIKSLQTALLQAGLTDNELRFYMAVLQEKGQRVYDIAKEIKIPSTTAYRIFDSLCGKKLLKNKDNKIQMLPLSSFITTIDKEHRRLYKVVQTLKENEKKLHFLMQHQDNATIDVFRGDDIFENYFDILYDSDWDHFIALGDFQSFLEIVDWDVEKKWIHKRVTTGRKAKVIFSNDDPLTREIVSISPLQLRKMFLDTSIQMKNKYINLFPGTDKTLLFTKDEFGPKLTLIKSKDVINEHLELFQHFWKKQY